MKPSGDFVVMEAKELVKLFDADGNAKKGTVLQQVPVPSTHHVSSLSFTFLWGKIAINIKC